MNRKGFTLVEAVVAVLLFSMVGMLAARLVLSSTRAGLNSQKMAKATALADMVFDHYYAAVLQNFTSLPVYDHPEGVAPKVFFATDNDFGYDGFIIFSTTSVSSDRSIADVKLTISWKQEARVRSSHFARSFTERVGKAVGGVVQVRVSACDGCPGLPGFDVSAEPMISDDQWVSRTSDSQGLAVLTGVKVSDTTKIRVSHPITRFDKGPEDGGVQGYVFTNADGSFTSTQEVELDVQPNHVNFIAVSGFRALGRVTGLLKNNSLDLSDGQGTPAEGMEINLWGLSVADGAGGFLSCTDLEPCKVQTKAVNSTTGRFGFYGVIPGEGSLKVTGVAGSDPVVQRSEAEFRWGYTAAGIIHPISLSWAVDGSTPMALLDGQNGRPLPEIYRMGWLDLRTVDETNTPIQATVDCLVQPAFSRRNVETRAIETDASGIGRIYNAIAGPGGPPVNCQAFVDPQGGAGDHGHYHVGDDWNCADIAACLGGPHLFALTLTPGHQVNGKVISDDGTVFPGAGVYIDTVGRSPSTIYQRHSATVTSDALGGFILNGFFPSLYGSGLMWGIVLNTPLVMENVEQTVSVYDTDRQRLMPGAPVFLWIDGSGGEYESYVPMPRSLTNAAGQITFRGRAKTNFAGTWGMPDCSGGAICHIDIAPPPTASMGLTSTDWVCWGDETRAYVGASANTTNPLVTLTTRLNYHKVVGQVTDKRGTPLQGIQVEDPGGNPGLRAVSTITDAAGNYTLYLRVAGRSPASPGSVQIFIPDGQTDSKGTAYAGVPTQHLDVSETADPDVAPFTQNFQLEGGDTGGGGL